MENRDIDKYISTRYQHWLEYADYQSEVAGLTGHGNDILNEVLCNLLEKSEEKLSELYQDNRGEYRGIDYFILRALKFNCQSKTAPYRWKYLKMQIDDNSDGFELNKEENISRDLQETPFDEPDEIDPDELLTIRYSVIREILDMLDLPENEKQIFRWKFFDENAFTKWSGKENLHQVQKKYRKVKTLIIKRRQKNISGYIGVISREKKKALRIRDYYKTHTLFPFEYRHSKSFTRAMDSVNRNKKQLERLTI